MRRPYRFLLVLVATVAGTVIWLARSHSEPAYQGKPLSRWIAEIKAGDTDIPPNFSRSKAQREAIEAMGLAALPALLESVRPLNSHESWWSVTYRRYYVASPASLRRHLPRPSWGLDQEMIFQNQVIADCQSLRPQSEPLLVKTLRHPRPEVRATAAAALGGRTNTSPEVFSGLTNCLRDPNMEVRERIVDAISCFGPAASNAVPAILENILPHDPSAVFNHFEIEQALAAKALGKIGSGAVTAVPVLQAGIAQRTNSYLRITSAIALWRIRQQAAETLPVLLQEFGASPPLTDRMILDCFREMGPEAAAAAPRIVTLLDSAVGMHDDLYASKRRLALETLWKIAPDVAAKQALKTARSRH